MSRGAREHNFLVGGCVAALWFVYGLVLLWARRADQRDEVYNTVTDLQQNVPTDQQPYIVTIITGFRRNAGTTSKVTATSSFRTCRNENDASSFFPKYATAVCPCSDVPMY